MLSPARIGLAILLVYGWGLSHAAPPTPREGAPPRALVIDSYHAGFTWSDRLEAALHAGLAAARPEVFTEWMDT